MFPMDRPHPPLPGANWPRRLRNYYRGIFAGMSTREVFDQYYFPLYYIPQDHEDEDEYDEYEYDEIDYVPGDILNGVMEVEHVENAENENDDDIDDDLVLFWADDNADNSTWFNTLAVTLEDTPDGGDASEDDEVLAPWKLYDRIRRTSRIFKITRVLDRHWFCYPISELIKLCVIFYCLVKGDNNDNSRLSRFRRFLCRLGHSAEFCVGLAMDIPKYFPATMVFSIFLFFWSLFVYFYLFLFSQATSGGWIRDIIIMTTTVLLVGPLVVSAVQEGKELRKELFQRRCHRAATHVCIELAAKQDAYHRLLEQIEQERRRRDHDRRVRRNLARRRHHLARRRCLRMRYWSQPQTREDLPYAIAYVEALRYEMSIRVESLQEQINDLNILPQTVAAQMRPFVYDDVAVQFSILDPEGQDDDGDDDGDDDDDDRPIVQPDPVDVPEWGPPPAYQFPQHMLRPDRVRQLQSLSHTVLSHLPPEMELENDDPNDSFFGTAAIDPVPTYDDYTQRNAPPAYFKITQACRIPPGRLHQRLRQSIEARRTPTPSEHSRCAVRMQLIIMQQALAPDMSESMLILNTNMTQIVGDGLAE